MAELNFAGPVVGQKNIAEPLNLRKDFFTVSGPSWNINEDKEENLMDSVSVSSEPLHIQEKTVQAIQKPAILQDKVDARVAETADTAQQMADFAVPVTHDQWRMISTAASQSDNPDEELQRYAAALTYSREYGVDTETALQNLDEFTMHQIGKPYSPTTTGVQAIANSFKVGRLNMRFNDLAYDLKQADLKGEDISGYLTELDAMANEIASLQDYQPRNIVTTALKWTMEGAVPYMIEVGKSSMMGATVAGALGTAFTGATGVALGSLAAASPWSMAAIIAMGATVAAVNRTRQLEEGATYLNLRQMGVDKDIANVLSRTNAMLVGAIEAGLGIEAGTVLKAIGGDTLVSQVTSAVVARLNTSGALGVLANAAASTTVGAGGEFIQEFTQEISDITHTYIAHAWQSMRTDIEPLPDENALKQALYAGYRGFVSAIVLGAASSVVNTNFDLRQQAQMNADAKANPSKEAFVAQMKDQKPETVTGNDWAEATSQIWEKAHAGKQASSAIESDEAAIAELDFEKAETRPTGRVRRLKDGSLYTEESKNITTDPSGAEHHRLLVGDPATSARYGYIDYSIKDNILEIDDVLVRSEYESIRKEAILDLAKRYPGYDIQWDPKSEALSGVYNEIVENNPRGKDAGLQYYDGITDVDGRISLEQDIAKAMPSLSASERAVGATLVQLAAEAQGKTLEGYLNSTYKDGKLFGELQEAGSVMQGKKGAVSFSDDLKAIIYAGENADFSTFVHENFHVALRNMGQAEQFRSAVTEASQTPEFITWLDEHAELFQDSNFEGMNAQDLADLASGFNSDTWNRAQEEFAARLYEGYLADGKTASPKLQGLFKLIAEWMGRIYTTLKHSASLDPRIVEVFDSMLDKDTPLAQAMRDKEQQNQPQQANDIAGMETLYQGDNDAQRQYDAVVSKYTGTDQWMKAPNGKATNLNERQWVQVRTPAFLAWFGDWINDPENASKVVDENGEPKVVYHNTTEKFTVFNRGVRDGLSGKGIYFSEYPLQQFGSVKMQVFLNIRNPITKDTEIKGMREINAAGIPMKMVADVLEKFPDFDGVINRSEITVRDTSQVKSATANLGTFDASNPNILFQEDGSPKLEAGFPKRPDINIFEFEGSREEYYRIIDNWKKELKEWVGKSSDLLQFGDEDLVHVIHKNVIPGENPWRSTSFLNRNGEWTPLGHRDYETKYEAVYKEMDFKNYRPDILFQEEGQTLAVLHNIHSERLIDIEALGGMPSPSIAVTRQDIDFTQFGDTTLIMDPSVATDAMKEGRLYNRDVWSPTVPEAEWKIDTKILQDFDMLLMKNRSKIGGNYNGIRSLNRSEYENGASSLVKRLTRVPEAMIQYLEENNIPYDIATMNPVIGNGIKQYMVEPVRAKLAEYGDSFDRNNITDSQREDLRTSIIESIEINEAGESTKRIEYLKNRYENMFYKATFLDRIFDHIEKYNEGATQVNSVDTKQNLQDAIKPHMEAFQKWLHANVKDAYSYPSIKIRGKKFSYDASSILDWMRTQKSTGLQSGITYGPGLAASSANISMRLRDEVAQYEQSLVSTEKSQEYYNDKIKPLSDHLMAKLPEYYQYSDTFEAYSSIFKAISRYLKGGFKKESPARMKTSLSRELFSEVPESLISDAVKLAHNMANQPQDYFEAKPDRVIRMNSIRAAVIPSSASAQVRRVLERNNILAIEYSEESQRAGTVREYIKMAGPSLLFQEGTDSISESILEEARSFDSWEEFMAFTQAFADPDDPASTNEAWYQEVFNEAHGIVDEESAEQAQQAARKLKTEQDKDAYMIDRLSTDEGVVEFLKKLGWMMDDGALKQIEGDYEAYDAIYEVRNALDSIHPTITNNAMRAYKNKEVTPSSIKRVRTLMTGDAVRYYRDVYANTMEDKELIPQVMDDNLPGIDDPGYKEIERLSIADRAKLATNIKADKLKHKFLSGQETFVGDAEIVIRNADVRIKDLKAEVKNAESEIAKLEKELTEEEKTKLYYSRRYNEALSALNQTLAKVKKLRDTGEPIPKELSRDAYNAQAKKDRIYEEVKAIKKTERMKATEKKNDAIKALKAKLAAKRAERAEAKRVREYKIRLARKLMVKPSDTTNYEQAKAIYAIQALIDPNFRRDTLYAAEDGQRVKLTLEEAREFFDGSTEEEIIDTIGKRNYERLVEERKPLNDWTVAELEELVNETAMLRYEGRRILEAKVERQNAIAERYQDSIMRSLIASGKYTDQPLVGTKQDQKEKQSPKRTLRGMKYGTYNMRVKAMMLDGDRQGDAYNLLVMQKRAAQAKEWTNTERRLKPFYESMKETGLSYRDLFETVKIDLDMHRSWDMSYSMLMYGWLSQFNEDNRNAVAYGSLVEQKDKMNLNHDNKLIQALGDQRYKAFIQQAEYHLFNEVHEGKYEKVLKAIQETLNNETDRDRINEIAIREFNKPMRNVEQYLPLLRLAFNGEDMAEQVAEDFFNQNAGGMPTSAQKGFTKDRIKISPDKQKPVNMDIVKVLDQSIKAQEHFIAFAEYGRKLNRVFKNYGTTDLKHVIDRTLGPEMMDDINEYINMVLNPTRRTDLNNMQKGLKFMRGNLGSAYLIFKSSSMVLQAITSPWPGVIDVKPKYLVQGYMQLFSNPLKAIENINTLSPMMKNRNMNVIIEDIIKQANEIGNPAWLRILKKGQEIGALGLTYVDRYAVAGQWIGAYNQRMDQLNNEGVASAEAQQRSIAYADDIILKTQPTGDRTELAPLFSTNNELVRSFVQFTTSLNVIWSNITYDMRIAAKNATDQTIPHEARKAQLSKVIGTIVGYGMAGAILGAVREGHDEDDDKLDKLRNFIYWSFTQGADSVPLIGDKVSELVRGVVTGDKIHFWGDDFFPALSEVLDGLKDLSQGDYARSLKKLMKGVGYTMGAPVSGIQELVEVTEKGPKALLGR